MTHEELLDRVNNPGKFWDGEEDISHFDNKPLNALRTVVELHKPIIHALPDETCWACQDLYPCPTIQAIEKELG